LRGRTVIVDDVITTAPPKRESVELLRRQGCRAGCRAHRPRPTGAWRHGRQPVETFGVDDFVRDYGIPWSRRHLADSAGLPELRCRPVPRRARRRGHPLPCSAMAL
jgi:hypothetical protein